MAGTARQSNTLFARIPTACAALLTAGILLQSASARADSCDFIKYDPPPGWTVHTVDGGKAYRRPDKNGVIILNVRWFNGPAEAAFSEAWREIIQMDIPGASQRARPQITRQGNYEIAIGAQPVEANGRRGAAVLTAVVGKERRLVIVGIGFGEEAPREIDAFMNVVDFREPDSDPVPPASALVGSWWKDAGNYKFWYEFTHDGNYSYEAPAQQRRTGKYRVQGNRITLSDSAGRAFRLRCVGGAVLLELDAEQGGYWASPKKDCSVLRSSGC